MSWIDFAGSTEAFAVYIISLVSLMQCLTGDRHELCSWLDFSGSIEAFVVYIVGLVIIIGFGFYHLKEWASRGSQGRRKPSVPPHKRSKKRNGKKNTDDGPPGRRDKDPRNVQIR